MQRKHTYTSPLEISNDILMGRVNELLEESKETAPITRLKQQSVPGKERIFVGFFEEHGGSNSFLYRLLPLIAKKFAQSSLVCLEHPITRTGYLEAKHFQGDGSKAYSKTIEKLCTEIDAIGGTVICNDDPDFLSSKKYQKKFEAALSSLDKFSYEAAEDFVRNQIMAHTINYFTSQKVVLSINGMSHREDLLYQLSKSSSFETLIFVYFKPDKKLKSVSFAEKSDSVDNWIVINGSDSAEISQQSVDDLFQLLMKLTKPKAQKTSEAKQDISTHPSAFFTSPPPTSMAIESTPSISFSSAPALTLRLDDSED